MFTNLVILLTLCPYMGIDVNAQERYHHEKYLNTSYNEQIGFDYLDGKRYRPQNPFPIKPLVMVDPVTEIIVDQHRPLVYYTSGKEMYYYDTERETWGLWTNFTANVKAIVQINSQFLVVALGTKCMTFTVDLGTREQVDLCGRSTVCKEEHTRTWVDCLTSQQKEIVDMVVDIKNPHEIFYSEVTSNRLMKLSLIQRRIRRWGLDSATMRVNFKMGQIAQHPITGDVIVAAHAHSKSFVISYDTELYQPSLYTELYTGLGSTNQAIRYKELLFIGNWLVASSMQESLWLFDASDPSWYSDKVYIPCFSDIKFAFDSLDRYCNLGGTTQVAYGHGDLYVAMNEHIYVFKDFLAQPGSKTTCACAPIKTVARQNNMDKHVNQDHYLTALYGLIKNPYPGIEKLFYQVDRWLIVLPKNWGIQLKVNGQKDLELRSKPTYMEMECDQHVDCRRTLVHRSDNKHRYNVDIAAYQTNNDTSARIQVVHYGPGDQYNIQYTAYRTQASTREDSMSPWRDWAPCSTSCGPGIQRRSRLCKIYVPDLSATVFCDTSMNDLDEHRPCQVRSCLVPEDVWSGWSYWTQCDRTCGDGYQTRYRDCEEESYCHGNRNESRPCHVTPCPIDGRWDAWSSWSECRCEGNVGKRHAFRTCSAPAPLYGGSNCVGQNARNINCEPSGCPVRQWNAWGKCDRICGMGLRVRTRIGSSSWESSKCNTSPCPVDGSWADWTDWTTCDPTCGKGNRRRTRGCVDPAPANQGADCEGSNEEVVECDTFCPAEDIWADWSDWGSCTVSCGGGFRGRSRTCLSPINGYGSKCYGERWEPQLCYHQSCAVDGYWSPWSNWGRCDASCGGGTQIKTRTCTNPKSKHGGAPCTGESQFEKDCNTKLCPVDSD